MLSFKVNSNQPEECLIDFETFLICRGYELIDVSQRGTSSYLNSNGNRIRIYSFDNTVRSEKNDEECLRIIRLFNEYAVFGTLSLSDSLDITEDLEVIGEYEYIQI